MSYTPKLDWTSANGVSVTDLTRIEQGIKDALPKDGSEPMTGVLNFIDGNSYVGRVANDVHVGSVVSSAFLEGTNASYLTSNCYYSGITGGWNRRDPAKDSYVFELNKDKAGIVLWGAAAGANPITTWVEYPVWNASNMSPVSKAGDTMTGALKNTSANPFISKVAGQKSYTLHNSTDGHFYIAPSATIDGEDWVYAKALRIDSATGQVDFFGGASRAWDTSQLRWNAGVLEYLDSGTWKAAGGVKSIQKGRTVAGSNAVTNVTITSVVNAKSTARATGLISAGFANSIANGSIIMELTTATNIAITNTDASHSFDISWEVIEYY